MASNSDTDVALGSTSSPSRNISSNKETMTSQKRPSDKDDGTTTPPTKTLKHTTISDKEEGKMNDSSPESKGDLSDATAPDSVASNRAVTPELSQDKDAHMKEHVASPKKKRGRELDDDAGLQAEETLVLDDTAAANGGVTNGGRTTRSAPEKKRPRDTSIPPPTSIGDIVSEGKDSNTKVETQDKDVKPAQADSDTTTTGSKPVFGSSFKDKPVAGSTSFASSGFGAAAAAPSGFASLAGKPSVFGGGAQSSGFGILASNKPPATTTGGLSSFASAAASTSGFGSAAKSGFGGLGSSGSVLGGGFGSGFAAPVGQKLSSFAAPVGSTAVLGAEKPKAAKAFGAPESDAEDGSEEDGSDDEEQGSDEESSVITEDKKKSKSSKAPIDDGESGETTLLQFRARIFAIESKELGWKERGVGTLKLNVPKSYVDYDDYTGQPILGSYDPSGREETEEDENSPEPVAARLIMRQENTHRVVLNTPIIKALKFEEKANATSFQLMFMAFENGKPVNTLLRLSEPNARALQGEISLIQSELGA